MKPIEQRQIEFQDDKITAVMVQDENGRENVYIPLRPFVEGMGLSWSGARDRIKRNIVLNDVCTTVRVTRTEQNRTRNLKMLCIPISHLNGFLFGINADRVKPDIRPLILEYQEKCYQVLFTAFNGTESMRRFYTTIGHEGKWIDTRIQKHETGTELKDIWLVEGIPIEHHDTLENELSQGIYGLSIDEHRKLKNLPDDESLKDNMTRLELIMSMLADEANIDILANNTVTGIDEHTKASRLAGDVAGKAVKNYEEVTKGKVLSQQNHLDKKRPSLKSGDA